MGVVATYVVEAGCVEAANGAGADENDMNGTMRGRKVSIKPARYGILTRISGDGCRSKGCLTASCDFQPSSPRITTRQAPGQTKNV